METEEVSRLVETDRAAGCRTCLRENAREMLGQVEMSGDAENYHWRTVEGGTTDIRNVAPM